MIDKRVATAAEAVKDIRDGSTVLISGFGEAGNPTELIHALVDQGARDLTVVNNNAGNGHYGLAALLEAGRVRKMICSFPRSSRSEVFQEIHKRGDIELEVVPQGTLAERVRAGGAGIGGFYTPTGVGTPLAEGKEMRTIDGRDYLLEEPIRADVALVKAHLADPWGNLTYRLAARNFGPVMCTAARLTIVQARKIVGLGDIPPEAVVTPSIFVHRVVEIADPASEAKILMGLEKPKWTPPHLRPQMREAEG
ncbi:MAG TPA: 3-oxoacid CoA-transferase subunit A [Rhodospirillales bacterium]|jgi:3-oxoadipate CoA-transferase alpha subunit